MNKQTYRVIFSKTLNRMIVVSELAKTCGKATSENLGIEKTLQNLTALYSSLNRHSSLYWTIKPLQFSLFLALGYVSFSPVAMADEMAIRADKSAPATQQATILKTANGLPQVNIQTPSPAGVSRNTYSQFDVAEKGAVLNNARKATQTQIAGWVQGNPNLATGEAKVILNEVNSTNPSRLKGYIEVAGKKANVVIANPSGIHCDGCGVINAGRSTLTTGKPEIENGELKGYHVKGGKVNIAGKGLDNRQADYTDIIAEKVKVEGGVWAKNLKVTTGKNKVNRTNDAVVYVGDKNNEKNDRTSTTPETAEATQTYRVDVSELGGMYAERIQLVDNGTGLGVRNAGHIGASVGEVQIDSQGRIVNTGTLNANQGINLRTTNDLENQGKIENRQGDIRFNSQSHIQQSGAVVARQGNIQATAKKAITQNGETLAKGRIRYNAERVNASKSAIIAAGATVSDQNGKETRTLENPSEQGSSLHITSREKATLQGQNLAAGKLQIDANEVDISHSQTAGYMLSINAKQQGITADLATITATDSLQWQTPALLSTQQADVKANWIDTRAIQIDNQQGRWASLGDSPVNLTLERGLNNQSGLMLIGGDFTLNQPSSALNNQYGRLFSAGSLQVNAQQLDNQVGILSAENNATLTLATAIQNQKIAEKGSLIQAQNTLTITAPSFDNSNTKPADNATPQQGVIAKKIALNTQNLNNQQGGIYSVENTTLNIAQQLHNQRGEILSMGNLAINGANAAIDNAEGAIAASANLTIDANGLSGNGDIEANHTSLDLKQDFHAEKDIVGRSSLTLSTLGNLTNQAGLYSEGNTRIQAANIDNQKHAEIQGKSTALTVSANLTNRGLIKGSEENIIKVGQTLNNIGTGRIYGGHTALQANKIINSDELQDDGTIKSAVIAATQRLDIAAPQIENSKTIFTQDWAFNGIGGTLASEGQIVFGKTLDDNHQAQGLSETLINRGGLIEGKGITFGVKQLNNENARLRTNLEEVSNQRVNEHYLIVDDPKIGERINFDQLRWRSFSRAGRVVYKNQAIPSRPKDGGIAGYILPAPNEEACANEQTRMGCAPVPQAIYTNQDPVWAAFNITPPDTPAPELPDLSGLDPTLKEPVEPTKPRRRFNRQKYERELREYEAKMVEYRKAMAEYEAKLIAYSAEMQPYLDWVNANAEKFEQLDIAIQKHNASLLGREFADFWDVYVTQRIERQTKVKETHPGKILSGGDIAFSGEVENNRSQIIAAGAIYNTADSAKQINNIEEMGITQIDDIGNQEWTYSRWRGGFRRYHQRKWAGREAHMRRTETPLALNQANVASYTAFTPEAENANVTLNNVALTSHQQVGNAAEQSSLQQNENEIRHIQANTNLPTSSLYRINPEGQKVLIETDPQFTDRKKWLSSDYMFDALRSEPQNILKRLGDGYYEQRVVRDQINQLTGRMFLDNQQDLETQYKALMDKGISFAKQFHLTPGIALNAEQVAALTSDIVWFEPQTVTLPSGKTVEVIAPRVYVVANKGDLNGEGALISANEVDLRTAHLNNLGTIAGRKIALLNTDTLRNEGTIQGDKVGIKTTGNFDNIGGKVEAERGLFIDVGGDFTHQSTTRTTEVDLSHFKRSETTLARKALLYVKGKEGELHLSANTILSQGADIINEGQGDTIVKAKTGLNLTALSVGFDEKMGKGDHYRNEKVQEAVVSHIKGNGDVLLSGRDITAEGANLESAAHLRALAENDIVLNGAKESRHFEAFHKTKSGSVAKVTKTRFDQQQSETLVGTQVSGNQVLLAAGNDVKAKGVQAIAENDLHVQAGHDVDIAADTNHFKNIHKETKKTSGVFTSGGGITFGSKSEKHDYQTEGWTQSDARSTLGSMNGNIRIDAGNHANVLGTDIITSRSHQIDLEGASAKVEAGKDIIETNTKHEYKQSGVTLSVSTPVTDMAQAAYNSLKRSQQVSNPKLKALYAMKAAEETVMAAQNVSKVAETVDALRNGNMQGTGTTASPSVKISIGYGSQKQTQTSETQQIEHQKSTINTGTFNATARSEKLRFEGVEANAALMSLSGKQGIEVKGVKDEEHQRTENKSVGGSVGVFVGTNGNSYGFGIEGSVNVAKGKSNSDSERWQNSHLTAEKVIIHSEAGELTLDAANLKAKRLEAEVQHLNITSRQDREKYESKQVSAGASGSVAYGSGGGASVNAAYSKAKVDYAQVNEQAGISVGEGGMNVKVHQHTQLNGGVIESEAETSKNRLQTHSISSTDIENHSEIKTESASISAGSGGINPMQALSSALSLLGNRHESNRSHTKSAISQNIAIQTKTPENLTALSRDTKNANEQVQKQDLQKVQEQQEMAKVIGGIVDNGISIATFEKREALNKLSLEKFQAEERYGKDSPQAKALGTQMQALQQQLDQEFGLGSEKGMAIRAVTAALQSAVQQDKAGAITALASPYLNREIHKLTEGDSTKEKATNFMAHALLSAVEFQVTGKDPLTGAMAGVTGEATAQYLTKALYNKAPSELTASEKETISSLSQLAGGLAGAFTAKANGSSDNQGGSVLTAVAGAETAKRAVENNHLSKQEEDEIFNIVNKFDKKGSLSSYAQERAWYLLSKDAEIDRLIQLHQKNPNALTANQKAYLYHEVKLIANSYPNLSVSDILNTDFSANMVRRDNSKIMNYLDMQKMFKNTPEYRIAEGVYEGVQYLPTMIKAGQVGVPLINKAIHSPVVKNTVIGLGSNASLQFLSGQDFNWFELGSAGIAGAVSPKLSTRDAIRVNMGIAMGGSLVNGGNPLQDVGLAGFGALAGSKFSNPIYSSVASDAIQKFPQILSKGENKQNEN